MDNKKAVEWLEYIKNGYSWSANCDKALDKAIECLEAWNKIKKQIEEEKEHAYADFEEYKIDMLGVEPEYVEDELPLNTFRYGMERTIEIINKHLGEVNG